jgi:uncharacterized protein YndB with AHSA1/START domain
MPAPSSAQPDTDREIVVSRIIEGPRSLVFEMFTDVEHLSQWWGPKGGITTKSFEFRPGGVWDATIKGPGGAGAYPNYVVWKEIVRPERIVWLYGTKKDDPNTVETILTLTEQAGSTEATLRLVFGSKEARDQAAKYNAADGAKQSLDRLAAAVTSK